MHVLSETHYNLGITPPPTFEGENFRKLVKNTIFTEKTFTDCLLLPRQRTPRPRISREKLSRIATKPQNLRKFSSPKVFRHTVFEFLIALSCLWHQIASLDFLENKSNALRAVTLLLMSSSHFFCQEDRRLPWPLLCWPQGDGPYLPAGVWAGARERSQPQEQAPPQ